MSTTTTPQSGEFCWNELMTPDTKKAQAFYTELLGWTSQDHDMGDMTYTMFMSGDKRMGGMFQTPKDKVDQIPPHWMSYISVEDVEETLEKAKALGADVIVPVTTVANKGRFIVITGPTGAPIAFWQCIQEDPKDESTNIY
ncbi:MAG: VOC family protein [Alphaproteobacteria bacterium]|nr:VOC family protein [Alphaproteobacteria bacterium]